MPSQAVKEADRDFPGVEDRTASAQSPIRLCPFTVEVSRLVKALDGHPAWDLYGPRKEQYAHSQMSDIWVRYNAWENYKGDLAEFNKPHKSEWYPVAQEVPELKQVVRDVVKNLGRVKVGGVLITKIPPGGSVAAHVDGGWHAGYYTDKYAVQLAGNLEQSFNFEGHSLSTLPGEVFWFDNSKLHWVDNPSKEERITMIICTRKNPCLGA